MTRLSNCSVKLSKLRQLNFAAAYGMSALCYVSRQWKRWMVDLQKEVSEAARLVDRTAALGRGDAMALSAAGMAAGIVVRDLDRAVVLLDLIAAAKPKSCYLLGPQCVGKNFSR